MMRLMIFYALLLTSNLALADGPNACVSDGQQIALRGIATQIPLKMADGQMNTVWVITTDAPVCINEKNSTNSIKNRAQVRQFQVMGFPPPAGEPIELTGKISTGNSLNTYVVPDALRVINGRKLGSKNSLSIAEKTPSRTNAN